MQGQVMGERMTVKAKTSIPDLKTTFAAINIMK